MSRRTATLQPDYFEGLYAKDADPWKFATSDYEQAKYDETLAILRRSRYRSALEVGCSIGVFTRRLAPRCDMLVALEPSSRALASARINLAGATGVTLVQGTVPGDLPEGSFELIVLSEVLYYLDERDARETMRLCCRRLVPDGEIVLCHWLGETDYPLSGETAATLALQVAGDHGFNAETRHHPAYRLDHLQAPS